MKRKRKYWYLFSCNACVLCGHEDRYKEVCFGRKPKKWWKRYKYNDTICANHLG